MTSSDRVVSWLTGRAQPPAWFRLPGAVFLIAAAAELAVKRDWVVGVVAAGTYGPLGLSGLLGWQKLTKWSKRHPLLDSLVVVPLLFLALAYITRLSTTSCLVIALPVGLVFAACAALRRARRRPAPR